MKMIPNDSFKTKVAECPSLIEEEKTSPKCDIVNKKGNIGTIVCMKHKLMSVMRIK